MTDDMKPANPEAGLYRSEFEHDACGIGALAHLAGKRSHQMIDDALSVLVNLEHRGGVGLEKNTGDGAGILFQIPHRFFRKEAQKCGHLLPAEGDYGVAMLFLPRESEGIACAVRVFEEGCALFRIFEIVNFGLQGGEQVAREGSDRTVELFHHA